MVFAAWGLPSPTPAFPLGETGKGPFRPLAFSKRMLAAFPHQKIDSFTEKCLD